MRVSISRAAINIDYCNQNIQTILVNNKCAQQRWMVIQLRNATQFLYMNVISKITMAVVLMTLF